MRVRMRVNPGIFLELMDFVASFGGFLKEHLNTAIVFKGTSKTLQNELLCVLSVAHNQTHSKECFSLTPAGT